MSGTQGYDYCAKCVLFANERDEARAEVARLKAERDDALASKEHCHQWYGVRWKRLKDWFRNEGKDLPIAMEFWNITANAVKSLNEPATYDEQMNMLRHEVERLKGGQLEAEVERLRGLWNEELRDLKNEIEAQEARAVKAEAEVERLKAEVEDYSATVNAQAQIHKGLRDEVERLKRKHEHTPMVHTVADKCRLNSHIQKLQEMRISVSDIQIEVSAERGLDAAARTTDRRNKAVKLMTDLIVSLVDLQHDMGKEGGA